MNQVVCGLCLLVRRSRVGIEDVEANVSLDDFGHQGVHCSAASGNIVKHLGALGFLFECSFNGLNLAPDSSDTI